MGHQSDGSRMISEERLCEIAGVHRPTRRQWAKRGLLRARAGYTQVDAVELSVLHLVTSVLGSSDGPLAWMQIRSEVWKKRASPQLDLVFDSQLKKAVLTTRVGAIGTTLRHGRPVRVISLAEVTQDIQGAFHRVSKLSA
jgi:hypothetical protein